MTYILVLEQILNGLQLGVMLFLMAAGLTLVFGVMGLINLAHGSLYMVGAFAAAAVAGWTGSFLLALTASLAAAAAAGALMELVVIRRLYRRDHLDQVLATFALILIFSEGTRWLFGSFPLFLDVPAYLSGPVSLPGGIEYPLYRLTIILIGLGIAAGLFLLGGAGIVGLMGVELSNFFVALVLLGLGWNFGFIGATTMLSDAHSPSERGRMQGMNDFIVFGGVTLASLSSGGLMNCSGGSPVEGWSAVNLAMVPALLLAGGALLWLVLYQNRRASA